MMEFWVRLMGKRLQASLTLRAGGRDGSQRGSRLAGLC